MIDNGSTLNVCGIDLLHKIKVDTSLIKLDKLKIHGFDNLGIQSLGTITLPIKVGPVTLSTLFHVMLGALSYNMILGRLWIHAMGAVPSTLH